MLVMSVKRSAWINNIGCFKSKCNIPWVLNPRSMWVVQYCHTGVMWESDKSVTINPKLARQWQIFTGCGGGGWLRMTLPQDWRGVCTRIRAIQRASNVKWPENLNEVSKSRRAKREYKPDLRVCLDSMGQPWRISEEFKATSEIKSGF